MSHEAGALRELLLVAGASLAVLLAFQRLRLPAAVGFIVTGVLIGPGGLGWVHDASLVHALADFGVMFLLFTVGLEFSRQDLVRLSRPALVGGSLQVALTGGVVAAVAIARDLHPAQAIFVGMLASLSSTALVFRVLTDRLELSSPHGRMAAGVLVFQDLVVLLFAVVVPWLSRWHSGVGAGSAASFSPLSTLAQFAAVALIFAAAHRGVPWLLKRALRGSREAFLFGVLVVALGSAFLTARLGLSAALGAFVAGMILAESDLRSHVEVGVGSFRDALTGVFFVAIGMLFEPRVVMAHPWLVLASTLGLVGLKAVVATVALRGAGATWRVAFAGGVALAQVGEFSFMLANAAPAGLLGATGGQVFFAGAVFSLLLTPFLVNRAAEWSHAMARRSGRGAKGAGDSAADDAPAGHVVIAGFGLNGSNVARVLRAVRLPHVIVDLDPDALSSAPAAGSRALLGDITQPDTQRRAGIERARVLIVALSDPVATRHACRIARSLSPNVFILVRTRTVAEIDELYRLGANQVIPEEFETSIEIFTAALRHFHVPTNIVQAQVQLLREERYSLLRGLKLPGSVMEQLDTILEQGTCDTFLLLQHSPAVGRTLGALGLLEGPGARLVAMVRGGAAVTSLEPEAVLQVGDILVMAGSHAAMEEAFRSLSPQRAS